MLKLDDCVIENGNFTLNADIQIEVGNSIAIIGPFEFDSSFMVIL